MQTKGVMAPYSYTEMPGKYAELIPMYEDWRMFWENREQEKASGNVPETQKQIDQFRKAHPRR